MRALLAPLALLLLAPTVAAASLTVHVENSVYEVSPGEAVGMPMLLGNDGDEPLPLSFALQKPPPRGSVALPPALVLEPGASREVTVTFRSVADFGHQERPEAFTVEIRAGPDKDVVSFLVTTRGFHVPGPGPLAPVAALAAVALLARARR